MYLKKITLNLMPLYINPFLSIPNYFPIQFEVSDSIYIKANQNTICSHYLPFIHRIEWIGYPEIGQWIIKKSPATAVLFLIGRIVGGPLTWTMEEKESTPYSLIARHSYWPPSVISILEIWEMITIYVIK